MYSDALLSSLADDVYGLSEDLQSQAFSLTDWLSDIFSGWVFSPPLWPDLACISGPSWKHQPLAISVFLGWKCSPEGLWLVLSSLGAQ